MARGDQIYRQWSVLTDISKARCSRRDLAERYGVTLKTITRDIDTLSQFPIVEEREGIDVYYSCLASVRAPHISLDAQEISALILGKESALQALDTAPFQDAFRSALDKVERLQQDRAFREARALPQIYQTHFAGPTIRVEHQEQLLEAALSQKRVWIRYFGAFKQSVSERVVEPIFLHAHPYGLHLIAYCLKREGFANFNVNLIEALKVLDESFSLEDRVFERDAFLQTGFDGQYTLPVLDVRLRISPPTAHWAKDRFFHATQEIIELQDGAVEVRFRAGGQQAIVARILGLGADCEVLQPQTLRAQVRQQAQKICARYENDEP